MPLPIAERAAASRDALGTQSNIYEEAFFCENNQGL